MKYYGYSDKKSKYKSKRKLLWFNILIIVLIITATVVFSLVLGNYLKKRLDNADISTDPIEHVTEEAPADTAEEDLVIKNNRTYEELATVAGYLDLAGCTSEDAARAFVLNLKSIGYSGVYFDLQSEDGSLVFASEAASSITGGKMSGALIQPEILKAAAAAASERGLQTGAGLKIDCIFEKDEASEAKISIYKYIIKELYDMGFEEIILSGIFTVDNFSSGTANALFDYISSVRDMCPGINIGIVMDLSILENPELTPAVELVFRYTDFFAVDFTDAVRFSNEEILLTLDRLSGSFSAYCIRVLSGGGSVDEIREKYALFASDGYINLSFVTPNRDVPEPQYDDGKNLKYESKIYNYSLTAPAVPEDGAESGENGNDG